MVSARFLPSGAAGAGEAQGELSAVLPAGQGCCGKSAGTPKTTHLTTLRTLSLVPGERDYDGEKTCDGEVGETLWKKKKRKGVL